MEPWLDDQLQTYPTDQTEPPADQSDGVTKRGNDPANLALMGGE
jgi:hypothetical protein